MPIACSVDAHRLFTECPLDGQDRPPDGLLQNGLCDFIPNPACQSFFLFIVCIGILYIQEELVASSEVIEVKEVITPFGR